MKICPVCHESNHDAANLCMLCGSELPMSVVVEKEEGDEVLLPAEPDPPREGTLALALYHDKDPRIVAYFPIVGEVTLIGREDAAKGVFPEVNLGPWRERGVSVHHSSRKHAFLLKRPSGIWLEVLPGTTGTQINRDMMQPGQAQIYPGDRVILGGRVRMKLMQF